MSQSSSAPSSWAQAYVGLPYELGTGECGQRAALVWRQEFGFDVEAAAAHGDPRRAQELIRREMASPAWMPVRRPGEGDAVLMWKGDLLAHVGVWVAPNHVLHCTRRDGMVLTPAEELGAQGFRIHGFARRLAETALAA